MTNPHLAAQYYRQWFPWKEFSSLASVPAVPGLSPELPISHREFSFKNGFRHHSFSTIDGESDSLKEFCCKTPPFRLDMGAVYSNPPKKAILRLPTMTPDSVELRFDIDITDYKTRRRCNTKKICDLCETHLKVGIRILDYLIRRWFGFRNLLWVFSGGRGVHCWVLDPHAAFLSNSQREEIVSLLLTYAKAHKKAQEFKQKQDNRITRELYHKFLSPTFEKMLKEGKIDLRESPFRERVERFSQTLLPGDQLSLQAFIKAAPRQDDWTLLKTTLGEAILSPLICGFIFPKIDIGVTRGINHLLRAPFSARDDNGNIVTPFDITQLDYFDFYAPLNIKDKESPGFRNKFNTALRVFQACLLCRDRRAQYFVCKTCYDERDGIEVIPRYAIIGDSLQIFKAHLREKHQQNQLPDLTASNVATLLQMQSSSTAWSTNLDFLSQLYTALFNKLQD
jgi:DNA primase small subunit